MCIFRFKGKITEPSPEYAKWLSQQKTFEDVHSYINDFTYVDDKAQFGVLDYWETPSQFFATKKGDCFTGDTKIIVVNKETNYYELRSLCELKNTWENYKALSYNFKFQKYEFKNITAFIEKGKKPVKKYWLRNNTYFKCTDDHRFFTANSLNNVTDYNKLKVKKIREIDAKDLSTNWRDSNHFIFMANDIPALATYKEDKDILWLKGLYTAEGFSENHHVRIANDNIDIRNKIESILIQNNITYSNSKRLKHGYQSILKSSLKNELKELGTNAFNKNIPSAYLSMNKEDIESFLKGNADGDGYRTNNHDGMKLVYSTSSDDLAEKIFFLHLILNRPLSLYYSIKHGGIGKKPIWRLYENINSRQKRKYLHGVGRIGIKKIEDIDIEDVYDITVEDNHNFILWNGVIAHNCEDVHWFLADAIYRALGWKSYLLIGWRWDGFLKMISHGMAIFNDGNGYKLIDYRNVVPMNKLFDYEALKKVNYTHFGGIFRMPDGKRIKQ